MKNISLIMGISIVVMAMKPVHVWIYANHPVIIPLFALLVLSWIAALISRFRSIF